MSTWKTLISYINKKEVGKILTRKELLDLVIHSDNTIDTYRNQLTHAGFLKTISPGRYQKIKNIPKHIPITALTKGIYDRTYRKWFMTMEELIKFHERKPNANL